MCKTLTPAFEKKKNEIKMKDYNTVKQCKKEIKHRKFRVYLSCLVAILEKQRVKYNNSIIQDLVSYTLVLFSEYLIMV